MSLYTLEFNSGSDSGSHNHNSSPIIENNENENNDSSDNDQDFLGTPTRGVRKRGTGARSRGQKSAKRGQKSASRGGKKGGKSPRGGRGKTQKQTPQKTSENESTENKSDENQSDDNNSNDIPSALLLQLQPTVDTTKDSNQNQNSNNTLKNDPIIKINSQKKNVVNINQRRPLKSKTTVTKKGTHQKIPRGHTIGILEFEDEEEEENKSKDSNNKNSFESSSDEIIENNIIINNINTHNHNNNNNLHNNNNNLHNNNNNLHNNNNHNNTNNINNNHIKNQANNYDSDYYYSDYSSYDHVVTQKGKQLPHQKLPQSPHNFPKNTQVLPNSNSHPNLNHNQSPNNNTNNNLQASKNAISSNLSAIISSQTQLSNNPMPNSNSTSNLKKNTVPEVSLPFKTYHVIRKIHKGFGKSITFSLIDNEMPIYCSQIKSRNITLIPIQKNIAFVPTMPSECTLVQGRDFQDFTLKDKNYTGEFLLSVKFIPKSSPAECGRKSVIQFKTCPGVPQKIQTRQPQIGADGKLLYDFEGHYYTESVKNAVYYENQNGPNLLMVRKVSKEHIEIDVRFQCDPSYIFAIGIASFISTVK